MLLCLCFFLFLMAGSRLFNTYFSPSGAFRAPEWNFTTSTLGRDLRVYSVQPWYEVRRGKTPYIFGYGSVLFVGAAVAAFNALGACRTMTPCGILAYQSIVAVSVLGFLFLLFLSVREKDTRIISLLLYGTLLLGVFMSKAFEAGNPDLFLAPMLGILLLDLRRRKREGKQSTLRSVALGLFLGLYLNMKAFLLLFVALSLILSGDVVVWIFFFVSFAANALWPWLYHVKSGPFDVFYFAIRGTNGDNRWLYTQVNYGNNAIFPYVSNVLQGFDKGKIPLAIRQLLTNVGGVVLFFLVLVLPWINEKTIRIINSKKKLTTVFKQSFSSYPFALLCFTASYVVMLTLTAWSYDYRIIYALPVLFVLLEEIRDAKSRQYLYLSIIFLVIKSLFIPKDRIMTAFLYLHFYFLLRAAIAWWTVSLQQRRHRKISRRFV